MKPLSIAEARLKYGVQEIAVSRDDGRPLAVIRPKNPALAIQIARVAIDQNDKELWDCLPAKAGEYTFIGWLPFPREGVPEGYVVDDEGLIVDEMQPGDSFVTLNDSDELGEKKS